MAQYTLDGDGILPGGLWWGQQPLLNKRSHSFARYLHSYVVSSEIGQQNNSFELLLCPSFTESVSGSNDAKTIQFLATGNDSYGNRYFGYPNFISPMSVFTVEDPLKENYIIETDNIMYNQRSPWNGNISPTPRHGFKGGGAYRTRGFFDGHVTVSTDKLQN